jgi:hypothetical protein
MFSLLLFEKHVYYYHQNHVVVILFRLLTHRFKQFCGLTLFGRENNFLLLVLVTCVFLLLGKVGVVFWEARCVRTRMRADDIGRKMLERA